MDNDNETCELCGQIIAEMHYWNLGAFPIPIRITPRYGDDVLSLCQRCFQKWEDKRVKADSE